jgi:type IV pilus assembly protein PilM
MLTSLFTNRIIGLEISREGIGAALLRGGKGLPVLEQSCFLPLPPDALQISRSDPHLLDPIVFVQKLKTVQRSFQSSVCRVALSLPDAAGRLLLLDLDAAWKSKDEAKEIILWKLKKNLPHEHADLQLDFQVLQQREGAPALVLVALVSRQIIEQYERLLYQAGFQPAWIDLHQVSLLRAFTEKIGYEGTSAFVSWYGENLGIVMIHNGIPVFWRSKYLPVERGNGEHIDQELHGSLEAYYKQWPERGEVNIFFFAPFDHTCHGLLTSLQERSPVLLEVGSLYQQGAGLPVGNGVIAAIAAAAGRV